MHQALDAEGVRGSDQQLSSGASRDFRAASASVQVSAMVSGPTRRGRPSRATTTSYDGSPCSGPKWSSDAAEDADRVAFELVGDLLGIRRRPDQHVDRRHPAGDQRQHVERVRSGDQDVVVRPQDRVEQARRDRPTGRRPAVLRVQIGPVEHLPGDHHRPRQRFAAGVLRGPIRCHSGQFSDFPQMKLGDQLRQGLDDAVDVASVRSGYIGSEISSL